MKNIIVTTSVKTNSEFKSVVRAKSEENSLYRDFKEITGYDGYLAVKEMKNEKPKIKL